MRLLQLLQPLHHMWRSYMFDSSERAPVPGRTQINRLHLEISAPLHILGESHQHIHLLLHHPAPFCPVLWGLNVRLSTKQVTQGHVDSQNISVSLCGCNWKGKWETLAMQIGEYKEKGWCGKKSAGKTHDVWERKQRSLKLEALRLQNNSDYTDSLR